MEKSQFASGVCGVGPAESTGKPRSRYCPGGILSLVSLFWRRPRNPREKNPSLMWSPSDLFSLALQFQALLGDFFTQFEDTFDQRLGARGTPRHIHVHRHDRIHPLHRIVTIVKFPARV